MPGVFLIGYLGRGGRFSGGAELGVLVPEWYRNPANQPKTKDLRCLLGICQVDSDKGGTWLLYEPPDPSKNPQCAVNWRVGCCQVSHGAMATGTPLENKRNPSSPVLDLAKIPWPLS